MINQIMEERIHILLADDSPEDAELTRVAFAESNIVSKLDVVEDGVECLKYLRKLKPYSNVVIPSLILLDLNMPRKNGREVLAEVKMDEELKHIPVIVLTTSRAEEDILASYRHHANCYVSKSGDFHSFENLVKEIENFWFSIAKFPTRHAG